MRYEVGESSSAPTARPLKGFRADYGFVATMDREIMRDLERDFGYGITDTWDEIPVDMPGAPATDDTELGRRMTEFTTRAADSRRQAAIIEMLAADHMRQAQFIEALKLLKRLQTQMTEFERQQGPAKGPAQPDAPEEAACNADRNTNGDDSHILGASVRRTEQTVREFENQVKFATCTLHSVALRGWNTHVKTVGHDAAYDMPWKTLMKMMTDKYCPRNEIKKLEIEIWDLKVKV
ncbi:hypothetical protein Tco_0920776 [Tanacetum coccineum]